MATTAIMTDASLFAALHLLFFQFFAFNGIIQILSVHIKPPFQRAILSCSTHLLSCQVNRRGQDSNLRFGLCTARAFPLGYPAALKIFFQYLLVRPAYKII